MSSSGTGSYVEFELLAPNGNLREQHKQPLLDKQLMHPKLKWFDNLLMFLFCFPHLPSKTRSKCCKFEMKVKIITLFILSLGFFIVAAIILFMNPDLEFIIWILAVINFVS